MPTAWLNPDLRRQKAGGGGGCGTKVWSFACNQNTGNGTTYRNLSAEIRSGEELGLFQRRKFGAARRMPEDCSGNVFTKGRRNYPLPASNAKLVKETDNTMIKRSLTLIACGAKALALVFGMLASAPSTANADGDCWWCAPDTGMCYPDEPCWDEC